VACVVFFGEVGAFGWVGEPSVDTAAVQAGVLSRVPQQGGGRPGLSEGDAEEVLDHGWRRTPTRRSSAGTGPAPLEGARTGAGCRPVNGWINSGQEAEHTCTQP